MIVNAMGIFDPNATQIFIIVILTGTKCIVQNTVDELKKFHVRFLLWACCWISNQ